MAQYLKITDLTSAILVLHTIGLPLMKLPIRYWICSRKAKAASSRRNSRRLFPGFRSISELTERTAIFCISHHLSSFDQAFASYLGGVREKYSRSRRDDCWSKLLHRRDNEIDEFHACDGRLLKRILCSADLEAGFWNERRPDNPSISVRWANQGSFRAKTLYSVAFAKF